MITNRENIHLLLKRFNQCVPVFIALGDENRQKLILDIAEAGIEGLNVTDLSAKSQLSRPAISHHLKVLKDAGLIKSNKKGTQIFYELSLKENFQEILNIFSNIESTIQKIETQDKANEKK